MKTKIKRHSRSVISVLLAVCMLVSCMTAGMIMTDAAKMDSESVGYSGGVNIGTSSTNSNNPYYPLNNNSCEFVVENDNTTIYWGFWVEDSNFWNTDDPDPDGSDGNIYYAKSDGNGCISKTLNAGRYKLTVTNVWKNDHGNDSQQHTLGYTRQSNSEIIL